MSSQDQPQDLASKLDEGYLIDVLMELTKVPTEVPLGAETFMEPDDPKLVHYVQKVLRPKLDALGVADKISGRPGQPVIDPVWRRYVPSIPPGDGLHADPTS